jgi:hypothetical protein
MYWNARLNAAGKQCGFWDSDPQHGQDGRQMGHIRTGQL